MVTRVIVRLLRLFPEERLLVDVFVRLDDMSLRAFDITVLQEGLSRATR